MVSISSLRFDPQYDKAIATAHGLRDTDVVGRSYMTSLIVFTISAITFRNFCLHYYRSMSAAAWCFASDSER
jgi:hypothetical protein